jgi:hypothetical protein
MLATQHFALLPRMPFGGVAGRSPLEGVAENASIWRLQPGEGFPQKVKSHSLRLDLADFQPQERLRFAIIFL